MYCATSKAKWLNPIGITKRYDSKAHEHGDACVSTMSLGHEATHGNEDVFLIDMKFSHVVQIVGDAQDEWQDAVKLAGTTKENWAAKESRAAKES